MFYCLKFKLQVDTIKRNIFEIEDREIQQVFLSFPLNLQKEN